MTARKPPPHTRAALAIAAIVAGASVVAAPPAKRAAPPEWTEADLDPFFPDVRAALVGERPSWGGASTPAAGPTHALQVQAAFRWSEIIDAETLEGEVKRTASRLQAPLVSQATFGAGGNNACRAEFAVLAVVFAVIDRYDGHVRWQTDAAPLCDALARASASCKSPTDQSYAEAARRRDELVELVRGAPHGGQASAPFDKWSVLADRELLMRRMERGMQDELDPHLADARAFAKAAHAIRQEAQLLAVLAQIIDREDYEYWDDETFQEYSRELANAAGDLASAAAEGDYETARAAASRARQACTACHDGYRP